jgi:hypothetical protein
LKTQCCVVAYHFFSIKDSLENFRDCSNSSMGDAGVVYGPRECRRIAELCAVLKPRQQK